MIVLMMIALVTMSLANREGFGYLSCNWKESPSMDQKFIRKRAMQVPVAIQCGQPTYPIVDFKSINESIARLNLIELISNVSSSNQTSASSGGFSRFLPTTSGRSSRTTGSAP